MSILYINARNVRSVLFRKNSKIIIFRLNAEIDIIYRELSKKMVQKGDPKIITRTHCAGNQQIALVPIFVNRFLLLLQIVVFCIPLFH